jgi:hypothetical protein
MFQRFVSCQGNLAKTVTSLITPTDRVMLRRALIVMMQQSRGLRSCPDMK